MSSVRAAIALLTATQPGVIRRFWSLDLPCQKPRIGSGCNKFKGNAIYAIAFASWWGTVVKNMADMAAASSAMQFGSSHEQRIIYRGADSVFDRGVKTRPASATVEFCL